MSDLVPTCIFVVIAVVSSEIILDRTSYIFCVPSESLVLHTLLSPSVCNTRKQDQYR